MASLLGSLKKLAAFMLFLVILAITTVLVFGLFVAEPINLSTLLKETSITVIIFGFGLTALYLLSHAKRLLSPHIGLQAATITQFFLFAITLIAMSFAVLGIFGTPLSTLLTSAGIISITVGLIISTFVGGILSGALVFTTYKFKVGEEVMVNNMPGRVVDMTALVMRIRTDVGQITIPNSAIASGGVIVTAIRPPLGNMESRIHYQVGDRVFVANEQGTVVELTAYHTTVRTDSDKQLTYLNTSILTGAVAIAKLVSAPSAAH